MFADAWCAKGGIDLVLMDVVMKDGSNGLDAAARIKASYPEIKVIVVTSMPDPLFLKKARAAGCGAGGFQLAGRSGRIRGHENAARLSRRRRRELSRRRVALPRREMAAGRRRRRLPVGDVRRERGGVPPAREVVHG